MTRQAGRLRPAHGNTKSRLVAAVLVTLAGALGGCQGGGLARPGDAVGDPAGPAPASRAAPGTGGPTASGPAPEPEPAAIPVAFAVHPTLPPVDLTVALATRLAAGQVWNWRDLGRPPGPLRLQAGPEVPGVPAAARRASDRAALAAVEQDPAALAVVPAFAAGPGVRVLSVRGRSPLRDPAGYPLTVPGPAGAPTGPVVTATLVGDIMLARRVGAAMAAAGDFTAPLRPAAGRLAAAGITVGTLESSLARDGAPRQGDDSFGADPRALAGVRLAGFDVLSLANNHVGDFGLPSLLTTVRRVRAAGIAPVGAGAGAAEARRAAVVERAGVRFGFLAFNAIGETPAAGPSTAGAAQLRMPPRTGPLNRADLESLVSDVRSLRGRVDVLVVLPHWGQQYTDRPVAAQRTVARALVDAGADLVVGSHPHWVQGAEVYRGRLVAYSLGNFVFDMSFSRQTQEGVALELVFWGSRLTAAEFVPVRIGPDLAPRFLSWPRGRPILDRLWRAGGPPFNVAARP
jgi:poly-gamma-glutamate synthesis protein (capsule biosynthesis protein)